MQEIKKNKHPSPDQHAPLQGVASDAPADLPPPKPERTLGLKIFDNIVYTGLTNISVFVISVMATYLTSHGAQHGKVGAFFQARGDWLTGKFKSMGMNDKSADMFKMVTFSFVDGSVMAPFVKMLEDRREKIGKWIDDKLGTRPKDDSVYAAEPKQSWGSVLGGRAATAIAVVSTAVALDKTGLNDKLFYGPGKDMGEKLQKIPAVKKAFGKVDVSEVSRISIFEFVYTSICTAGLYLSSRLFARLFNKKDEKPETAAAPAAPKADTHAEPQEQEAPRRSFASRVAPQAPSHTQRRAQEKLRPAAEMAL